VLLDTRGLWRSFDEALKHAHIFDANSAGIGRHELREIELQDRERLKFPAEDVPQSAVVSHMDEIERARAAKRDALLPLIAECGWRPTGPCSSTCDWPTCAAGISSCIEGRRAENTIGARLRRNHGAQARTWYLEIIYYDEDPNGAAQEQLFEIGADGYETRKIGYFPDRKIETADAAHWTDRFRLSPEPAPLFSELAVRDDLVASEISASEFESRWLRARQKSGEL